MENENGPSDRYKLKKVSIDKGLSIKEYKQGGVLKYFWVVRIICDH